MIDTSQQNARSRAMAAFAAAPVALLREAWKPLCGSVEIAPVRGPETGLVMLRGRIGGGGGPFNLGEASVTRASVRLSSGEIGHAMVLGRDLEKARLAAAFDAAWQNADFRDRIEAGIIVPSLRIEAETDCRRAEETEATRVDFFTMARGED